MWKRISGLGIDGVCDEPDAFACRTGDLLIEYGCVKPSERTKIATDAMSVTILIRPGLFFGNSRTSRKPMSGRNIRDSAMSSRASRQDAQRHQHHHTARRDPGSIAADLAGLQGSQPRPDSASHRACRQQCRQSSRRRPRATARGPRSGHHRINHRRVINFIDEVLVVDQLVDGAECAGNRSRNPRVSTYMT